MRVDPENRPHVVWNNGRGIFHSESADRGRTWSTPTRIFDQGGDGGFDIGPKGERALRVVPLEASGATYAPGVDGVFVSPAPGEPWTYHPLPGTRLWQSDFLRLGEDDGTPRAWDPIAFDRSGALYAAWGENETLVLAKSRNLGRHWEIAPIANGKMPHYAFLRRDPSADSSLAITWFTFNGTASEGSAGPPRDAFIARISWPEGSPLPWVSWAKVATRLPDSYGEYFETWVDLDGTILVAAPAASGAERLPFLDFRSAPPT